MSSIQRKLALLIGAALLVLAFAAPSAMAVQISDPETGEPCPAVSPAINKANPTAAALSTKGYESGGCTVQMTAVAPTWVEWIGYGQNCYIDYQVHLDAEGWGYASNFVYNGCSWGPRWDQTILPAEVAPSSMFKVDQNTDFVTYWQAQRMVGGFQRNSAQGTSLSVTAEEPLSIQNQTGGTYPIRYGYWNGDRGLVIE
jgi:hypothetical protein